MNRKYRKTVVAGNWKMFKTPSEAQTFANEIKNNLPRTKRCNIILCVPFVSLSTAVKALKDSRIAVAAQNLHYETHGAFTGEVSAPMLADLGVKYVLVGHSERREYFGETDFSVNRKIRTALDAGLRPILCVGESLAQRELGVTAELIAYQVKSALSGVTALEMNHIIIAYEPVWAIGTGKTASPEEAGEVCAQIRSLLRKLYDARIARGTTIQYGGSMNSGNAHSLLAQPDIDGGLIGSASLDPSSFLEIVNAANEE